MVVVVCAIVGIPATIIGLTTGNMKIAGVGCVFCVLGYLISVVKESRGE